jgi:hypothetical protein
LHLVGSFYEILIIPCFILSKCCLNEQAGSFAIEGGQTTPPVLNQEQGHRKEHSDDRTGSSKQESEATAFHFTVNLSIRGHISDSNERNNASSSWQP